MITAYIEQIIVSKDDYGYVVTGAGEMTEGNPLAVVLKTVGQDTPGPTGQARNAVSEAIHAAANHNAKSILFEQSAFAALRHVLPVEYQRQSPSSATFRKAPADLTAIREAFHADMKAAKPGEAGMIQDELMNGGIFMGADPAAPGGDVSALVDPLGKLSAEDKKARDDEFIAEMKADLERAAHDPARYLAEWGLRKLGVDPSAPRDKPEPAADPLDQILRDKAEALVYEPPQTERRQNVSPPTGPYSWDEARRLMWEGGYRIRSEAFAPGAFIYRRGDEVIVHRADTTATKAMSRAKADATYHCWAPWSVVTCICGKDGSNCDCAEQAVASGHGAGKTSLGELDATRAANIVWARRELAKVPHEAAFLNVARFGDQRSTLKIGDQVYRNVLGRADATEVAAWAVFTTMVNWPFTTPRVLVVDPTGIGAGVADLLHDIVKFKVVEAHFNRAQAILANAAKPSNGEGAA